MKHSARRATIEPIPFEPESNVIPLVAPKRTSDRSVWIAASVLAIAAILLFLALDGRRRALTAPATSMPTTASSGLIAAPPDLAIPRAEDREAEGLDRAPDFRVAGAGLRRGNSAVAAAPLRTFVPPRTGLPNRQPAPQAASVYFAPEPYPSPRYEPAPPYREPSLLPANVDRRQAGQEAGAPKERVYATRLASPATTVPLGTVIPAVLETALDSTRPGAVRAIVSRDVRGFDGSRTLIPRGSRIYGEYGAELAPGQSRALIRWTRLVRPDGALVALDSPASDPLGRAGVKGKVDSKFLERFGEALLQSTLSIGSGLVTRRLAGDGLVFALPGSNPQVANRPGQQAQRTLTIRQGASVSVFVARDLDFTAVEDQ